jgi:hypothetical protein
MTDVTPIDPTPPADAAEPGDPVNPTSPTVDLVSGVAFVDNPSSDPVATAQFIPAPVQNGHIVEQRGFGRQTADHPVTVTQLIGGQ